MNEIKNAILQTCPELNLDSIEFLGEGDFCRAFLVNKNLVFRFAKHAEARQSLRRENCLLPKIADKFSLQIPVPLFAFFDGKAENSFAAYEFLPADALTREKYLKLGEQARTRCAGQVAEFLDQFHATDPELAEKCGISKINYTEKYTALLKQVREVLFRRLEKKDFEIAVNELENYLASGESESFEPVLLHGDLSPDHVLFDGIQVTSIIDFGDMTIGDRAWDFLWIYEDYGADFFERAVSKYDVPDKESFITRVRQFSKLEAIQWIVECADGPENDFFGAVEHLKLINIEGKPD
jgi:aminoglycoside 2''-phosphotransferase